MIYSTISVVIPTHNRSFLLRYALDSLVLQTDPNFEVVVVSDSNDIATEALIKSYYPILDISFYKLSVCRGGPSCSRNYGASQCRGDHICFLDDDDYFLPTKIATLKQLLLSSPYDLVFHPLYVVDSKLEKNDLFNLQILGNKYQLGKPPFFFDNLNVGLIIYGNPFATSSCLIKRHLFLESGGFNENTDLNMWEDYDLWIRLSYRKLSWYYLGKPLGAYYLSTDSISRSYPLRLHALSQIRKHIYNDRFSIWIFYVITKIQVLQYFEKKSFLVNFSVRPLWLLLLFAFATALRFISIFYLIFLKLLSRLVS